MATLVHPMFHSLEIECPIPWTETQESQLHQDYPFDGHEETDETFVIRNYLETLWLPESITSLEGFIHTVRRIRPADPSPSSSPPIHPLHALLDNVLLRSRDSSDKYRTELVQIIADGGGAGELEEAMMWYAWNSEKAPADDLTEEQEEKWRRSWLDRLEQKETKIQILLYMLKLSLPGPCPPCEYLRKEGKQPPAAKKREGKKRDKPPPPETVDERLESFMDKLSMWQLTSTINAWASGVSNGSASSSTGPGTAGKGKAQDTRDWTQIFCEDTVEPLFKAHLPDQCALLRSKVFPMSAFSDVDELSNSESIMTGGKAKSRTNSRAPSAATRSRRGTSPLLSDGGRSATRSRAGSIDLDDNEDYPARSRSRSLSVSLAQDQHEQRKNVIDPRKGRHLSREVSMSRLLKAKEKVNAAGSGFMQASVQPPSTKQKPNQTVTLIAETPVKKQRTISLASFSVDGSAAGLVPDPPLFLRRGSPTQTVDSPTSFLVEDTPARVKRRPPSTAVDFTALDSSPLTPVPGTPPSGFSQQTRIGIGAKQVYNRTSFNDMNGDDWLTDENADESFTGSFGSPDVLLLSGNGDDRSDSPEFEESEYLPDTRKLDLLNTRAMHVYEGSPTKKRKIALGKFKNGTSNRPNALDRQPSPEF